MAGGGTGAHNNSGGGTGGSGTPGTPGAPVPLPSPKGPFSWNGGNLPSTFDPKAFGTTLFGNLDRAFKQGPNPIPYSPETSGLISSGLAQTAANANGPLGKYASGAYLGAGNPYLDAMIGQTNDQVSQDVNSSFNSSGLYGSSAHAQGLASGLANADNGLRYQDYQQGFGNMIGAQNALAQNTSQGLGLSGLLDAKTAESDPFNYISKYINLLNSNSGQAAANTNQPLSLWDILGGVGSVVGSFL